MPKPSCLLKSQGNIISFLHCLHLFFYILFNVSNYGIGNSFSTFKKTVILIWPVFIFIFSTLISMIYWIFFGLQLFRSSFQSHPACRCFKPSFKLIINSYLSYLLHLCCHPHTHIWLQFPLLIMIYNLLSALMYTLIIILTNQIHW